MSALLAELPLLEILSFSSGDARLPSADSAPATESRSSRSGGTTILVVDDDESIRDMLRSVLTSAGYSVRLAADGEAALAAVEKERPSLVLLDMRMPKVDGWEFARRLKHRGLRVPILVMTAVRDAQASAAEIEAVGYLTKPFDIEQLLGEVARYGNQPPN